MRKLHRRRTVYTHTELYSAAWLAVQRGMDPEVANRHDGMVAIVMAAFAVEAYVNHVGSSMVADWTDQHQRLNPKAKLALLASEAGFSVDFGRAPFQSLTKLWKLRNFLAHADTRVAQDVVPLPTHDPNEVGPLTDWEQSCQIERASALVDDVREALDTLHRHIGHPHSAPLSLIGTSENTVVPE